MNPKEANPKEANPKEMNLIDSLFALGACLKTLV
jgi:hypothetical protein